MEEFDETIEWLQSHLPGVKLYIAGSYSLYLLGLIEDDPMDIDINAVLGDNSLAKQWLFDEATKYLGDDEQAGDEMYKEDMYQIESPAGIKVDIFDYGDDYVVPHLNVNIGRNTFDLALPHHTFDWMKECGREKDDQRLLEIAARITGKKQLSTSNTTHSSKMKQVIEDYKKKKLKSIGIDFNVLKGFNG